MSLKWIPNALTLFRCLLAVISAGAIMLREAVADTLARAGLDWHMAGRPDVGEAGYPELLTRLSLSDLDRLAALALAAFLLAMLSDWLDGFLARKLDAHSAFGAWLDPIADKLLVGLVLVALSITQGSWVIIIPAAIIICRDLFISWLRGRLGGGYALPVMQAAKWKTALEMAAIALILAAPLAGVLFPGQLQGDVAGRSPAEALETGVETMGLFFLWIAAALSAWTGWVYWRAARGDTNQPAAFD